MIYVTSDLHFGHDQPFLYEPRGFNSIKEHDTEIIRRWNEVVKPEDEVFILGDLMLNNNDNGLKCLRQLNGLKTIVLGNHDSSKRMELYHEEGYDVQLAAYIKYGKYTFYLTHWPCKVGNYDDEKRHNKFYNLCGHTHTSDRWLDFAECKAYHVELDAHDCTPVSIEEIKEDIRRYSYGL